MCAVLPLDGVLRCCSASGGLAAATAWRRYLDVDSRLPNPSGGGANSDVVSVLCCAGLITSRTHDLFPSGRFPPVPRSSIIYTGGSLRVILTLHDRSSAPPLAAPLTLPLPVPNLYPTLAPTLISTLPLLVRTQPVPYPYPTHLPCPLP